jgi:hypothetical protein
MSMHSFGLLVQARDQDRPAGASRSPLRWPTAARWRDWAMARGAVFAVRMRRSLPAALRASP